MNDKSMAKIAEIYKAAVEINDLSEKAGFAMTRHIEEKITSVEMAKQVEKAKDCFERILTELLAFEVRDFDALIKALEAEVTNE